MGCLGKQEGGPYVLTPPRKAFKSRLIAVRAIGGLCLLCGVKCGFLDRHGMLEIKTGSRASIRAALLDRYGMPEITTDSSKGNGSCASLEGGL